MVEQLFASYGAAQDDVVFRFASDVVADQSTEIDRMEKMLAAARRSQPAMIVPLTSSYPRHS